MLRQRQRKNLNLVNEDSVNMDFSKMRVGLQTVDDVLINLSNYKKVNSNYGDKKFILNAIYKHDYRTLREISNYFFESNGIYYQICKYFSSLYRYDWYITPFFNTKKENNNKLLNDFYKVLNYLNKSNVKVLFNNIALQIIKEGVFYGMVVDFGDKFSIQQLPANYCRSRFFSGVDPIVELNLQFFDSYFPDPQQRLQVLKTFSSDIQKAYVLYRQGKLKGDYPGKTTYWVALDPGTSIKFSLNGGEFPFLVDVIPSIIDLDKAQELDRQKTMQQLLKILVQKLPRDKNGDLIFDVDEAKDIHNNAVAMLKRAVGIDVLTTFADIEKIDTKDANSATTTDDLAKVERTVYNNAGVTKNLFNADGNLAMSNSILVDEASIREIPLLFQEMLNRVISKFERKNHYWFYAEILETTQFNYKEMSKMYKEQAQMGYSKMLPQVALGHTQSSILATMRFENEVLNLVELMKPPMTSNTMSSKDLGNSNQSNLNKSQNNQEVGRPKKEDSEKSEKTIMNQESMS